MRYKTKGTCSTEIELEVEDGVIKHVAFINGCAGNAQGVARLAVGRKASEIIDLLKDVTCNGGPSCPAQLAAALTEAEQTR